MLLYIIYIVSYDIRHEQKCLTVERLFNYTDTVDDSGLMCDCEMIHPEAVVRAKECQPEQGQLNKLAGLFKILGDPTRMKILWTLDQNELCVCDIANVLNMTKSAISHQLAVLKKSEIVKYRRTGKEVYYSLDDEHITKLYEIGLEHVKHSRKVGEK